MFYDFFSRNRENLTEHHHYGVAVELKNLPISGRRGQATNFSSRRACAPMRGKQSFPLISRPVPIGRRARKFFEKGSGKAWKIAKINNDNNSNSQQWRAGLNPREGGVPALRTNKTLKRKNTIEKNTHNEEGKRQTWASIDVAECYASSKIKNNWHKRESELRTRPWRESELRSQPFWAKKNPRNLQKRAENMEIPQIPSYIVGGLLPGGPQ